MLFPVSAANISSLVISLVLLSACVGTEPAAITKRDASLDLYSPSGKVTVYEDVKFFKTAQKSYDSFKQSKEGYYGAFAYSYLGAFGRTTGHNSLETAREYAIKLCKEKRNIGGPKCTVIATLSPTGFSDKGNTTLSMLGTKTLAELKHLDGHKAFATNDAGYYYSSWEFKTLKAATTDAISKCNENAKKNTPKFQKLYPCKIIYKN